MNRSLRRVARALAVGLMIGSALTGCTFRGIDLVKDRRVHIVTPVDQATVSTPLTLRWTAERTGKLRFAVFVDRKVMRRASTLRSLVPDDDTVCRSTPGCPDAAWLGSNGVHVVSGTSLVLTSLKDNRPSHDLSARDAHTITVVLLDGDRRHGEGSWSRQVYIDRNGQ